MSQEWISIDELLPENEQKVVTWNPTLEAMYPGWGVDMHTFYAYPRGAWFIGSPNEPVDGGNIKHWMPRPEPPKGAGE